MRRAIPIIVEGTLSTMQYLLSSTSVTSLTIYSTFLRRPTTTRKYDYVFLNPYVGIVELIREYYQN